MHIGKSYTSYTLDSQTNYHEEYKYIIYLYKYKCSNYSAYYFNTSRHSEVNMSFIISLYIGGASYNFFIIVVD